MGSVSPAGDQPDRHHEGGRGGGAGELPREAPTRGGRFRARLQAPGRRRDADRRSKPDHGAGGGGGCRSGRQGADRRPMMSDITTRTQKVLTGLGHAVEALESIGTVAKDLGASAAVVGQAKDGVLAIAALVSTVLAG